MKRFKNLKFILGGILLTALLFIPLFFLQSCPLSLGLQQEPSSCPFFVDQNQDATCDLLAKEVPFSQSIFDFRFWPQLLVFILILAFSCCLIYFGLRSKANLKKARIIRYLILTFSLIFFGLLFYRFICPIGNLQLLIFLKEGVVTQVPTFLIFLIPIILSLILGRIFCGFICPMGALQELIFKIPRLILRLKIPNLSQKIPKYFNWLRYLILIALVFLILILIRPVYCEYDPFGALFSCSQTLLPKLLLLTLALVSLFIFRPYCRFICPYGAILTPLSKVSIFKLWIDSKKCTRCGKCSEVCEMTAIEKRKSKSDQTKINFEECVYCLGCFSNCPKSALSLSYKRPDSNQQKNQS